MQAKALPDHVQVVFPEVVARGALPVETHDIAQYLISLWLGNHAGALGAVQLAQSRLAEEA